LPSRWRTAALTVCKCRNAEPSTLKSAVPNWSIGDEIPLGRRTLRVVGKRDDDADQPPVLIVEQEH
jgi:hypothetical protein